MSENLQSIIKAENDKITNLSNGKKPKYSKYENPQKKECTIPWCKKCHVNPRILSIEERIQISKKMEHKFKRYKTCNNNSCLYCIKTIQKLNKKIELHNQKVQEEKRNEQTNHINEDIEMRKAPKEENKKSPLQLKEPNIQDFTKIKIEGDGNCLPRAILKALNLDENDHPHLRKELAKTVENHNYSREILKGLNYENAKQIAEEIRIPDSFIGYETFAPFCIKYNLIAKIYLEDNEYKGNKWIEIKNETSEEKNRTTIFLSCHQGSNPELEGHFDTLIPTRNNNINRITLDKIKTAIQKMKIPSSTSKANIMIWNADSIANYTKRSFLIEQLYTNNIQICFLQETMLKKEDKFYI